MRYTSAIEIDDQTIDNLTEAEAKAALRESVAVNYAVQWGAERSWTSDAGTGWHDYYCPECGAEQYGRHKKDCKLGQIVDRFILGPRRAREVAERKRARIQHARNVLFDPPEDEEVIAHYEEGHDLITLEEPHE